MLLDPRITLSIGLNETQDNFLRRLHIIHGGYIDFEILKKQAFMQAFVRDVQMAKSVNDLKNPLLRLLEQT